MACYETNHSPDFILSGLPTLIFSEVCIVLLSFAVCSPFTCAL